MLVPTAAAPPALSLVLLLAMCGNLFEFVLRCIEYAKFFPWLVWFIVIEGLPLLVFAEPWMLFPDDATAVTPLIPPAVAGPEPYPLEGLLWLMRSPWPVPCSLFCTEEDVFMLMKLLILDELDTPPALLIAPVTPMFELFVF
jgi:hypothetical protein